MDMSEAKSLQETYAPEGICFGCGPANREGLRIRSFVVGEELVASFQPELKHQAFEGMLNGGIIGSLLDCHCNWMAAWHLMQRQQLSAQPCTVTAEYTIKMLKPTPIACSVFGNPATAKPGSKLKKLAPNTTAKSFGFGNP